jgi:hypothetical protein
MQPVIEELRSSNLTTIEERDFYAIVRLKKMLNPDDLELLELNAYCAPPACLEYQGTNPIPSNVGFYTGSGIQTDGRAGYLIFGPYIKMQPGQYILQITGNINTNNNSVIVDVVSHDTGKTYALFNGLEIPKHIDKNVLLEEIVILDKDATAIEVRVKVDAEADLFINGYSLKPITNNSDDI